MEVLEFLSKHWVIVAGVIGAISAFVTLRAAVRDVKRSTESSTKLLSERFESKINEFKTEVSGEIKLIDNKLQNLCDHTKRQNGRLDKCENWQLEHTEHYHSRRGD